MSKLITFFLLALLLCSIFGAIMQGGGGIQVTSLTSDITAEDAALPVSKTTDYLGSDYVVIGNEKIFYTGKTADSFTGCTRGYDGTTASAHASGASVYTADASGINNALGFNIAAEQDSMGWWATITVPFKFFTVTVPRIIRMNMSFLSGNLSILAWIWFTMAAGFIITLALALAGGRRV